MLIQLSPDLLVPRALKVSKVLQDLLALTLLLLAQQAHKAFKDLPAPQAQTLLLLDPQDLLARLALLVRHQQVH